MNGGRIAQAVRLLLAVWALLWSAQDAEAQAQFSFIYVLNESGGNQIYGLRASEGNGSLNIMSGFPISVGQAGSGGFLDRLMCIDRDNNRLFVVNRGAESVSAYAINRASGALTELVWSPLAVGAAGIDPSTPNASFTLSACAVHPSGSPLVVSVQRTGFEPRNGFVHSFNVSDASATAAAGSPFALDPDTSDGSVSGPNPNNVRFSPTGTYLYAGGANWNDIAIFTVNAGNGTLSPIAASPFNDDSREPIRGYRFPSDGEFLAVAGRSSAADPADREVILYYSVTAGVPSLLDSVSSGLDFGATSLLHPDGFYLVADRDAGSTNNQVGVYRFSSSVPDVSPVTGSPFQSGGSGFSQGVGANLLARTDNGEYVFVGHSNSRNFTRFAVSGTDPVLTNEFTQDQNTLGASGRLAGISFLDQQTVCGDGTVWFGLDPVPSNSPEACDDGNTVGGDGCSADCTEIEPFYACPVPGQACVATSQADISIVKSDNVTSADAGASLSYDISVANGGPDADPSVSFTDSLPSTLTCTFSSSTSGGATGNTVAGAGDLSETLNLPSGASVDYTVDCDIDSDATGTLSNTANASGTLPDPDTGNNSATDNDTVLQSSADLSVSKTVGQPTSNPGGAISYSVVVTNNGPSDAPGTSLTDTVPAEITDVTWTCSATAGSSCGAGGAGNVINDTADLVAGGQATWTINGTVAEDYLGELVNSATAQVGSGVSDPDGENNSDGDSSSVLSPADVRALKTVSGRFLPRRGRVTYTIELRNSSAQAQFDDPATDEFTDELPNSVVLVDAEADSGSISTAGNTVTWNGSIPGNGVVTITIEVTLDFVEEREIVSNQGEVFFDSDGDGMNDTVRLSDDPVQAGADDPTVFQAPKFPQIPTLPLQNLALLVLLLWVCAVLYRRFIHP